MSSKILNSERLRSVLLLAICCLLFLFVLQAKTAVYNGKSEVKATPTTASKLWVDGYKWDVRSVDASTAIVFSMASLFLLALYRKPEWRAHSVRQTVQHKLSSHRHLERFLRPPPVV